MDEAVNLRRKSSVRLYRGRKIMGKAVIGGRK